MPSYKDNKGKWYCSFYYTDYLGNRKKKKKEGFERKKDADEFERNYINSMLQTADITFSNFVQKYNEDVKLRQKQSTYEGNKADIEKHIIPILGNIPLKDITPLHITKWQNSILEKNYSPTYQRKLNDRLSVLFNYAVNFYGLPKNPCKGVKKIGKAKKSDFDFWTVDEYKTFIANCDDKRSKLMVETLFWTGMRRGELLALKPGDIKEDSITVNKTISTVSTGTIITTPKTSKSNRVIDIPSFLSNDLQEYIKQADIPDYCRIFEVSEPYLGLHIDKVCQQIGLKRITVHQLRHSHASYLISKNFSIVAVADRLGHENIQTTLNTYSHLYKSTKEDIISAIIQDNEK